MSHSIQIRSGKTRLGRFQMYLAGLLISPLLLSMAGCGEGALLLSPFNASSSGKLQILTIYPASIFANSGSQDVTISGSNFVPTLRLTLNGIDHCFEFINEEKLILPLTERDTSTAGSYTLELTNVATGTSYSSVSTLAVNYPRPSISIVSPSIVQAGTSIPDVLIRGQNFFPGSVVTMNGIKHSASYIDSSQLLAKIDVNDGIESGLNTIVVTNPAPGGGVSNSFDLTVLKPSPIISTVSPSSIAAGASAFALTVSGTNFTVASSIYWNGSSIPTSYQAPNRLTGLVPASSIAFPGTANVMVVDEANRATSENANVAITGHLSPDIFFVSPEGNDSNTGSANAPFLTVNKCATTAHRGQSCAIRGGTYRESVTPNSGITIQSYNGEVVTLDGTDLVTEWRVFRGAIFQAQVALPMGDGNQLFVGKEMMTEARWPNGADLFHVNWATAGPGTKSGTIVDPHLPNLDWTSSKIHLWSGSNAFSHQTGTVTRSSAGAIQIDVGPGDTCPSICPLPGGYYFLYGSLAALDSEREWFYDAVAGTLYFWAPNGSNPDELKVSAKKRSYAFDLSGRSNVTLRNLSLFACNILTDPSSEANLLDGIEAKFVSHFTLLKPLPSTVGGWSMILDHIDDSGIVLDGKANILRNSTIAYSAGNGIALKGSGITIENNLIYNIDYIGNYSAGIAIENYSNQSSTKILHNTIHTVGRNAIEFLAVSNEEVAYNNLFGGMYLSRDGGEIYACCDQLASNTRIHHNWIHDTKPLVPGLGSDYALSGIYIDNGSSGFEIDQNVLWNNNFGNIIVHGTGGSRPTNIHIHNNSIPDLNSTSFIFLNDIQSCGSTAITDNQVFLPIEQSQQNPSCQIVGNDISAPGATEMGSRTDIGCTLAGCKFNGPPITLGNAVAVSISIQPFDVDVTPGASATFRVRAEGSTPRSFQWMRNGVEIDGANADSYTLSPVGISDDGAVFSVQVTNALGTATSDLASLRVFNE